ncbi:hypothetical protein [Flavobacterium sp. UGB4466]|uniref:hypothetical protein n=1 Tax=Flavobacterium sp. UGB4466 TaxID=2730889 RepID=UPI00192AEC75|nr:hypothetical protein [Flavobacterium sp. UGB4466]
MKNSINQYYNDIGKIKKDKSEIAEPVKMADPETEKLVFSLQIPSIIQNAGAEENFKSAFRKQHLNKKNTILTTPAVTHSFFASEISSYTTSSKDLTFQKTYAVLSTSDKTLFLGGTFTLRCDKELPIKNLFSIGLKAKVDDDFSSIFKNGNLNKDIGINVKYHFIANGSIYYEDNQLKMINEFREQIINKLSKENLYSKSLDESIKKEDFYNSIAEQEVDYIRKYRLYEKKTDWWISTEFYLPVSPRQYEIIKDISTTDHQKENFYPWTFTTGATYYTKYSKGLSYYVSLFGNIKNNNNIETDALTKYTLPVYNSQNSSLIEKNLTVYGGDFQKFLTPSISGECISFFLFDQAMGLSTQIEKTFGDFDTVNWKLGIPVSLKDKDGKPTVNFEIAWKEVNKDHFIGINVGLTFGKFIK